MTATTTRPNSHDTPSGEGGAHGHRVPAVGVVLGVVALLALMLGAFAWPATQLAPRGVPIAVAGPPAAAAGLGDRLAASAGEDAFDVRVVADRAAAEEAVREREVYGAVVLGPQGGEMLTASAAGPAVSTLLAQVAASVPAEAGGPLEVTDVVALPDGDPRGAGLASALLPLSVGGLASGAAAALAMRGRGRSAGVVAGVAVLGGLVVAGMLQGWLGVVDGPFWSVTGAVALGVAAVGYAVLGASRLLGRAGLGLVALTVLLLGNPLSGVTSAPELLPQPWGDLGQWLPPGAAATLLRSVTSFDGAGAAGPLVVLAVWAGVGLVLALLPERATLSGRSAPASRG